MDQYDSQQPWQRHQDAEPTPIYDRLVAEWRSSTSRPAASNPERPPAPRHTRGFVPAARAAADGTAG